VLTNRTQAASGALPRGKPKAEPGGQGACLLGVLHWQRSCGPACQWGRTSPIMRPVRACRRAWDEAPDAGLRPRERRILPIPVTPYMLRTKAAASALFNSRVGGPCRLASGPVHGPRGSPH
jgi:hypothetical protein